MSGQVMVAMTKRMTWRWAPRSPDPALSFGMLLLRTYMIELRFFRY